MICAGMVRNEIDILDGWISHLNALFDHIVIFDHLSTDGTRERLHELAARIEKLEVREFNEPKHEQSRLMTETFREFAARFDRGWMFFLDADEFIVTPGKADMALQLASLGAATTIRMKWCNGMTVEPASVVGPGSQIEGWVEGPSDIFKIAVNLRFAERVEEVRQGNHDVNYKVKPTLRKIDAFPMLHLPIRSGKQISSKIKFGSSEKSGTDLNVQYPHWKFMDDADVAANLRLHAFNYGYVPKGGADADLPEPPVATLKGTLSSLVPMR